MNVRKYFWIAYISARSHLAYLGDVTSRFLLLGVLLYVFLRLWKVTYAETGQAVLGGLTLNQMLWYLVATESILLSAPRVAPQVDEEVRTGTLALRLIRPVSYPMYRLCITIGERIPRFVMNLTVGSLVAFLLVGPVHLTWNGLAIFAAALPLAFVLDFLSFFLIGLGAFWLEDTSGLVLIYSRITMILGGVLIPVDLFPGFIQPLLKALPFASIVYGPAKLFVDPNHGELMVLLAKQGIAVALFSLAVWFVYSNALKRVFANGG